MINIEKIPVISTNIVAIGFDHAKANESSPATATLRIWFNDGSIYDYEDVWQGEYEKLHNATSIGSYFASNIKGKYSFKKV